MSDTGGLEASASAEARRQELREASLVTIATMLLRERWTVVKITAWVFVPVLALLIIIGAQREYQAESVFKPETPGQPQSSSVGVLIQQLGAGAGGEESVDFYTELLRSRDLLLAVARTEYVVAAPMDEVGDSRQGTLIDLLEIEGESEAEADLNAVRALRERIELRPSRAAGLVTVRTRAPWPDLAEALNRQLLELVNDFNLRRRQSQAAAERRFVENRLEQSEGELNQAVAELREFLESNRRYEESPQLQFEHDRLQSQLTLRQQVYSSLSQSYEQARIDEVRNTPVITIIDAPDGSAEPVGRGRRVIAITALLGGLMTGLAVALLRGYVAIRRETDPEEYTELAYLWRATLRDLWATPRRLLRGNHRPADAPTRGPPG